MTIFLDQPPSCLQLCPAAPNLLVIGTYLLSEKETSTSASAYDPDPGTTETDPDPSPSHHQTKTGSLQLFELDPATHSLTQLQRLALPHAIYDLRFSLRSSQTNDAASSSSSSSSAAATLFAVATSVASVSLYRVVIPPTDGTGPYIENVRTLALHEDAGMQALFLAWIPPSLISTTRATAKAKAKATAASSSAAPPAALKDGFAVSFSDGSVALVYFPAPVSSDNANANTNIPTETTTTTTITTTTTTTTAVAETTTPTITTLPPPAAAAGSELWTLAFHPTRPILYSGDDLCILYARFFSPRSTAMSDSNGGRDRTDPDPDPYLDPDLDSASRLGLGVPGPALGDRGRFHAAGVTAIVPLSDDNSDGDGGSSSNGATVLLTGCYDEYLRVYAHDTLTGRRQVLAEERLGGGVWRLLVMSTVVEKDGQEGRGQRKVYTVLASCMHAGARVVRVTEKRSGDGFGGDDGWGIEVLAAFTEHESMNYASDVWQRDGERPLFISSSFYDKRVCVWKANGIH